MNTAYELQDKIRAAQMAADAIPTAHVTWVEGPRVLIQFIGVPGTVGREIMKRNGFKFNITKGSWVFNSMSSSRTRRKKGT